MSAEGEIIRPLLVVVTFLGFLVLLIGLIMAESPILFVKRLEDESLREVNVPSQFESIDILYYGEYENDTVRLDWGNPYDYALGGWEFWLQADYYEDWIQHSRHYKEWLILWKFEDMEFFAHDGTNLGIQINASLIDYYYQATRNSTKFIVRDDAVQLHLFFTYNHNTYDNCSHAWGNSALYFMSAIEFDQQNTGMNVWSLLSMLIFFRLPNIHPLINVVIALPIWVCVVVTIAIIIFAIIKSLPFT